MVHAACEALGVPILTSERYEADDVIGTLALKAVAAGFEVAIVTMDKDFYQLVGDRIRVYNPRDEGTWYDAEGVKEKFGVAPDHVVDVLALMGDTIDNIKGVPGVGEKGARELIVQYGSLDNLLAHAAEVKNKRYREGLLGNMDAARQSRELARIRVDVPVEFDAEQLRYRAGSREARLRDLQRARLPRARQGIRADRRHHRQDLPGGQHRRRRAGAGRAAARGRPVRVPRAAGRRDRDARGDCRDLVLDRPARRRLRADRPPLARQHREPAARDRAGGAAADSRGRHPQEGGPRSEVRRDRAGPARRHARRARPRHHAGELPARRDALGAPDRGPRARAHQLQGADRRRTSAAAAPRRSRSPRCRSTRRWCSPASAPIWSASWREPLRGLLAQEQLAEVYATLELPLVPVLKAVERAGVRIDTAALAAQSQTVDRELAQRSATIFEMAGGEFNINSPKQLAEVLFDKLQLPVLKRTGTSKAPSTAVEVLEELALSHDIPRQILEWRQLMKLKGTYIDALPLLVHPQTGRVHTCFNQAVASTGRLSSSDPNLQNIPIRTPLGREIRRAFIADPGNVLISADYSQIEFRVLAHLSEEPVLVDAFREGVDFHERTAREDFRRRQRPGSASAAQHRQDGQLRAALRQGRVHARQGHRRHAAGRPGVHRRLLRRLSAGARVHRPHARRGSRDRRGQDDVRAAAAGAGAEQPRLSAPRGLGARGGQHADPGQRRRHPEARDDRRPRRAAPASARRA